MKCLSIKQPFAWLICNGIKDVENRTWATNYRGLFYIHAGKQIDYQAYEQLSTVKHIIFNGKSISELLPTLDELQIGGIVGISNIIDCVSASSSPWFSGPYGFVLYSTHSRQIPFIPCNGKLGFFDVAYPEELYGR